MNGAISIFTTVARRICVFTYVLFLSVALTGCVFNNYNNDPSIATSENGSCINWRGSFENGNKVYTVQVGELTGVRQLAVAAVDEPCDTEINFSVNVKNGKAKLVLVDPNLSVTVLKEVTSQGESAYNDNISVRCLKGRNLLKVVGENYTGDFKITQEDPVLFQYEGSLFGGKVPKLDGNFDSAFNEEFPFGSRQRIESV